LAERSPFLARTWARTSRITRAVRPSARPNEYDTEDSAREFASQIYGGQVPTQIVRISREVVDAKQPAVCGFELDDGSIAYYEV